VPAAAVIPAPIAYIKVVAVKTFVVELVFRTGSTKQPVTVVVPCLTSCLRIRKCAWTYYRRVRSSSVHISPSQCS
jgi:hypothetical protein